MQLDRVEHFRQSRSATSRRPQLGSHGNRTKNWPENQAWIPRVRKAGRLFTIWRSGIASFRHSCYRCLSLFVAFWSICKESLREIPTDAADKHSFCHCNRSSSTNLRGKKRGWLASRFLLPPSSVSLYDLSVVRRLLLSGPQRRVTGRDEKRRRFCKHRG
jgi:hypothetical protein